MKVKASSFADLADLHAYQRAISSGDSVKEALAKGDNGVGCWGDNTAQTVVPMAAIPPEDMISHFGSVANAKHKPITVTYKSKSIHGMVADIMPHLRQALAQNGCRIDLNPAFIQALGLPPSAGVEVDYEWQNQKPS